MSTETKQPNYWKSLNELAQNQEYKKYVEREFPENATELTDEVSRRGFLKIMGASIALAGFAACRRPVQKILPYSRQPEDVKEGIPLYYATAMPFQDVLNGLLIESNEGRPTKAEGNDKHPGSLGSSSIFAQASVLGLYDPDRSRSVVHNGNQIDWAGFVDFAAEHFSDTDQNILFISEANSSLTYSELKKKALDKFDNAAWVTYEPFGHDNIYEGHKIAFGSKLRKVNHFDKADVIVSLDDDFLNPAANPACTESTKRFAESRKVRSTDDEMSRFYMVENTMSLTGTNADNRLRLKAGEIEAFVYALAAALSEDISGLGTFEGYSNTFSDHKWIGILKEELLRHKASSVLTAGAQQSRYVHATVAAINSALENAGKTVEYLQVPYLDTDDQLHALEEAVNTMNNGDIDSVVMIGGNPAFTAPSGLGFADALNNVDVRIHLSEYLDETSRLADWHVNRAHFLEAWSDGYSYNGARSVIQPLIRPLFGGKNELEFLSAIIEGTDKSSHELVQQKWKTIYPVSFEKNWRKILHDGIDEGTQFEAVKADVQSALKNEIDPRLNNAEATDEVEVIIKPDNSVFDGRFANNGWLQEMPDPVTKITWDNVALMSKKTAEKFNVGNEDVIRVEAGGQSLNIPVWILPGHADDSITITAGQGRKNAGRVADGAGVNAYTLLLEQNTYIQAGVSVSRTGETEVIATTQDHHSMEGRSLVRSATLEEYKSDPDFATFKGVYGHEVPGMKEARERGESEPVNLFDAQTFPEYEPQWGMTIDLNACTGCSACVVACVAENNIPVIGKREVNRGREMHWIRTDRYFEGDVDEPLVVHQPVPCMQCELAPCEQVCPVAATTHSDDGMNQMAYNRCIGTRYCANNCPYKVRRFNFFNYAKEFLTNGKDPEVIQMAMNPEVTVRFRGVMEKCTYCVQRVNRAKINRKIETDGQSVKPEDGTVKTACQQACAADAITFGDLTDEQSEVVQLKRNERNYSLLEELNTRPRTTYLAKLKNPNPELTTHSTTNTEHH